MSALSDFAEAALLNHLYRGAASIRQDSYWLALFTTATADDGTGTEVDTADWTNYARVQVDASLASTIFTAATAHGGGGQVVDNGVAISFGTPTVPGSAPDVTHIAVMTALTGGNMIQHGPLAASKPITNGDPVSFPIGTLDLIFS